MERLNSSISQNGLANFTSEALLDALPVAVYAIDPAFRVVYTNHPEGLTCVEPDGSSEERPLAPGDNLLDHLPEPERSACERMVRDILDAPPSEGPPSPRFMEITSSLNARSGWGRVVAGPISDSQGNLIGVLFVCHGTMDPDEMKRHREERDAARLDVARQLAVTLNHEINNPLFIISATLEDLLADASDPDIARRLHSSLDAVWRVASAVKQLQDIRQVVTTAYIGGMSMIDLEASQEPTDRRVMPE